MNVEKKVRCKFENNNTREWTKLRQLFRKMSFQLNISIQFILTNDFF